MALAFLTSVLVGLLLMPRAARAGSTPIRLSVNKWKVQPGDDYSLSWSEGGDVRPVDDFALEESADPTFKDTKTFTSYPVRAHHKKFENSASLAHTVRYYRVRAKVWLRPLGDEQSVQDEVTSNVVRVILVGTNRADKVPSFPDDPEDEPARKKKDDKDKDKPKEDDYPAMGRPDLIVTRIQTEPEHPRVGVPFMLRILVRNVGVFPSAATNIRVEAGGRAYMADVEPLKPNYTMPVPIPNVRANATSFTVRVVVDPQDRVAESREDNNVMERTLQIEPAQPAAATPNPGASAGGSK